MAAESRDCAKSVIADEDAARVGSFAPAGRLLYNAFFSLLIAVYQIDLLAGARPR